MFLFLMVRYLIFCRRGKEILVWGNIFLLACIWLAGPLAARGTTLAGEQDGNRAEEILRQVDDLWRSTSSEARLEMMVKTKNYTRTMVMDSWTKGREKSLVRITSPLKEI